MRIIDPPIKFRQFGIQQPNFLIKASITPYLVDPAAFSVIDEARIAGHGFGFTDDILIKAVGEYFERFIAFRAIRQEHLSTIDSLCVNKNVKEGLREVISQTCDDSALLACLENHQFLTVRTTNMITGETAELPQVFFTLHSDHKIKDFDYIPIRDSSGTALHPDPERAEIGALLEFIERQCLTAMWAAQISFGYRILSATDFENNQAANLARQMMKSGRLHCYDISFIKGSRVFCLLYEAYSEQDDVQFCCGAAASFDEQSALTKALIEVWQSSLLLIQIPFFDTYEYGSRDLRDHFASANQCKVHWQFHIERETANPSIQGTRGEIISSLAIISDRVFVFRQDISYPSLGQATFCKIFSPDFFVHMNPGKGNNNNNRWVTKIANGRPLRLTPLPFS